VQWFLASKCSDCFQVLVKRVRANGAEDHPRALASPLARRVHPWGSFCDPDESTSTAQNAASLSSPRELCRRESSITESTGQSESDSSFQEVDLENVGQVYFDGEE